MAKNKVKIASFVYDFTVDGGAVSTITPAIVETLPVGAIVKSITSSESTAIAGTGTIQFKCGSTALTAALAVSAFTGIDVHALTSVDGVAVTGGDLTLVIASNTITAGYITVFMEYYY